MERTKTQVFYDGGCRVCQPEIKHYQRKDSAGNIEFIDIDAPSFCAKDHGLDEKSIHQSLHVKLADGSIRTGVEAFNQIWENLPGYALIPKLTRRQPIKMGLELGYAVFSRVRPLIPRIKREKS